MGIEQFAIGIKAKEFEWNVFQAKNIVMGECERTADTIDPIVYIRRVIHLCQFQSSSGFAIVQLDSVDLSYDLLAENTPFIADGKGVIQS